MEKIYNGDELVGIVVRDFERGSLPVTGGEEGLQLLTVNHPKGHIIKPHVHIPHERVTQGLQECLVVVKGKIIVDLYGSDKALFRSVEVGDGEAFIALRGGHGVRFADDAQVFELKNGPFFDDKSFIG